VNLSVKPAIAGGLSLIAEQGPSQAASLLPVAASWWSGPAEALHPSGWYEARSSTPMRLG